MQTPNKNLSEAASLPKTAAPATSAAAASPSGENILLTAPVRKLFKKFAIPCVISLLISALYNIVDQIFVGNSLGYIGNAATGVIFPITVIGWGIALLFGDGAAAALSLDRGRGDAKNGGRTVANAILGSLACGLLLIVICYAFGDGLLRLLGATDQSIAFAHDYGFIIYAMLPLALVQTTLASIIRADGAPQFAMFTMLIGAVLNMILDPIAIFALDLGIAGAAYATIFGQFVSFVLCIIYLFKSSKTFRLKPADFKPSFKSLRKILPLGGSSFLTQISIVVITIVSNVLLVSHGAASEFGADIPLAAFVIIMKLFQIILCIGIGIAVGVQPIISFNFGAGRHDRVKQTFKLVLIWIFAVSAVATLAFELFPAFFIKIFGAGDDAVYLSFAVDCMRIYLSLLVFTCLQKACSIFLQSIGKPVAAIVLALVRDVFFLVIFSFVFAAAFGVTGLFWAAPAADLLAILITAVTLIIILKKLNKKIEG
jgi:putative MATE family efflux protein